MSLLVNGKIPPFLVARSLKQRVDNTSRYTGERTAMRKKLQCIGLTFIAGACIVVGVIFSSVNPRKNNESQTKLFVEVRFIRRGSYPRLRKTTSGIVGSHEIYRASPVTYTARTASVCPIGPH
ncbi:hypothetical protein KPB2_5334 [Klebsiella pneumoniae Kb677]|nr:hypothetical protein KPB2_5334 [Klebsiella pneumoniae Kb677]